jgi:hypothetical protein
VAHDTQARVAGEYSLQLFVRFAGAMATTTIPACSEKPMPTPPP